MKRKTYLDALDAIQDALQRAESDYDKAVAEIGRLQGRIAEYEAEIDSNAEVQRLRDKLRWIVQACEDPSIPPDPRAECIAHAARGALGEPFDPLVDQTEPHRSVDELERSLARLRVALESIAHDRHQSYDSHGPARSEADRQYQIGVCDGHRCAAKTAREALAETADDEASR